MDGGISSSKLKIDRDVVDRDESGGIAACGGYEQKIGLDDLEEMRGKHPLRCCSKPGKLLLESEGDQESPGDYKECNDLATGPGIQCTPKIDAHN